MSEIENQIDTGAPPPYAAPPTPPPAEPAQMNALQRLSGIILSPGETFRDVNRKPTIIVPILLGMILAVAGGLFFNWKVKPDWDRIFRTQIQRQLDRSGQSLPPEQIRFQISESDTCRWGNSLAVASCCFVSVPARRIFLRLNWRLQLVACRLRSSQ